jgi:molybdenum cofactor biosynthesis enzyme MoaA
MTKEFQPTIISATQKTTEKILPYLSFPLTKFCQFRCLYCGVGGETTASHEDKASVEFVLKRVQIGYNYGIRKFRLTGGEPLSHPYFNKIVDEISQLDGVSLLVNTNGDLIERKQDWISSVKPNVRFAVSFDAMDEEKFDKITGTKGHYNRVVSGIKLLSKMGKLTRLNLVVTKQNVDEIFRVIDFCRSLGCNLKILEVCSVPIPYNNWEDFHVFLDDIEAEFVRSATDVEPHEYSKSFGIPMPVYNLDGVKVTIKSSAYGSRYDVDGICKGCSYFPCHEGLYDMYLLPDDRLCGCRWSETSVAQHEEFISSLDYIATAFQRSEWRKIENLQPMTPLPPFVCNDNTNSD